ncbi:MAG: hypothetical protein LBI42_12940 [Chitinispirillales bacterium]|jgi:hypothetical protein|nr:hypothetical protein [Chitinispirillales bacterium]
MLKGNKVSAYGGVKDCVDRFKKDDYVLLYYAGKGVVAVGKITSSKSEAFYNEEYKEEEKYQKVEWLVPKNLPACTEELCFVKPSELKMELGHGFFYASTAKTPYLSMDESERIRQFLGEKYIPQNQTAGAIPTV